MSTNTRLCFLAAAFAFAGGAALAADTAPPAAPASVQTEAILAAPGDAQTLSKPLKIVAAVGAHRRGDAWPSDADPAPAAVPTPKPIAPAAAAESAPAKADATTSTASATTAPTPAAAATPARTRAPSQQTAIAMAKPQSQTQQQPPQQQKPQSAPPVWGPNAPPLSKSGAPAATQTRMASDDRNAPPLRTPMTAPPLRTAATPPAIRTEPSPPVIRTAANAPMARPTMTSPMPASAAPQAPVPTHIGGSPRPVASSGYRLGAGDKVRVTVYGEDDLSGEFEVDGAGYVRLPLVGQIGAVGRTVHDFEGDVATKLADGYLKSPRVSVEIVNYRPFFILGEVNKPGEYPYVNGMNVVTAVALAGGFTYRADEDDVYIRRGGKPEAEVPADERTQVQPGDIIRVTERFF